MTRPCSQGIRIRVAWPVFVPEIPCRLSLAELTWTSHLIVGFEKDSLMVEAESKCATANQGAGSVQSAPSAVRVRELPSQLPHLPLRLVNAALPALRHSDYFALLLRP